MLIPLAVGLAPVLLMLMTWAPDGDWSSRQLGVRAHSLPVVGAELFVIVLAWREGLPSSLRGMSWPRPVLAATAGLLAVALATAAFAPNPLPAQILSTTFNAIADFRM